MDKSIFTGFMEKLLAFPLWIKQTIFLDLSKDLNTYLSNEFLDVEEANFSIFMIRNCLNWDKENF